MGTNYLPDSKSWTEITRDERFYCAEFYRVLSLSKENIGEFVNLIKNKCEPKKPLPENNDWEIGFEVCFYRDVLHHKDISIKNHSIDCEYINHKKERISITRFPAKRTFDLCLFQDGYLIIIEAKAAEGYKNKQLDDFKADMAIFKSEANMLFEGNTPKILFLGLHSSKYSPKLETLKVFDLDDFDTKQQSITWCDLHKAFARDSQLFSQADGLYPSKSKPNC